MAPLIYVVDGLPERRSFVQHLLERAGYRVEVFATNSVLQIAEEQIPSAMIIATALPDGSGFTLRDSIRKHELLSNVPVFMLTDTKIDQQDPDVIGEGWLSLPLIPERVIGLLQASLSRTDRGGDSGAQEVELLIDPSAMKIFVSGKEIATTTLEFRLLEYMARHRGKVFTRDALLDAVWGDLQFVTPRSVDACIRRIRRKMEIDSSAPRFLRTIRGVGYKLEAQPRWETAVGVCHCNACSTARLRSQSPASTRPMTPMKAAGGSAFFN